MVLVCSKKRLQLIRAKDTQEAPSNPKVKCQQDLAWSLASIFAQNRFTAALFPRIELTENC